MVALTHLGLEDDIDLARDVTGIDAIVSAILSASSIRLASRLIRSSASSKPNTGCMRFTVTPGHGSGTRICDCWRWRLGLSGSVLPIRIMIRQRGSSAPDVYHLRPLITYSSPSRRISVSMLVASDDATSISVMPNADRVQIDQMESQRLIARVDQNIARMQIVVIDARAMQFRTQTGKRLGESQANEFGFSVWAVFQFIDKLIERDGLG